MAHLVSWDGTVDGSEFRRENHLLRWCFLTLEVMDHTFTYIYHTNQPKVGQLTIHIHTWMGFVTKINQVSVNTLPAIVFQAIFPVIPWEDRSERNPCLEDHPS